MAVFTGSQSEVLWDSGRIVRCGSWTLNRSRPFLQTTPLNVWDQTGIPGELAQTGTINLLVDGDDTAAAAMAASILDDDGPLKLLQLVLSRQGAQYPLQASVRSVSPAVSVGSASVIPVGFVASDVDVSVQISGPENWEPNKAAAYEATVQGLDGAWTYLWQSPSMAVQFSDPTAQNPFVTFTTPGTYTLQVTATLGQLVVTDTQVVNVNELPIMWGLRIDEAQAPENSGGIAAIDTANGVVYYVCDFYAAGAPADPVVMVFKCLEDSTLVWAVELELAGYGGIATQGLHVMSNGDLVICKASAAGVTVIRMAADGSLIYAQENTNAPDPDFTKSAYSATHERIYYTTAGSTRNDVGYINAATGAVVFKQIDVPLTSQTQSLTLLDNGEVWVTGDYSTGFWAIRFNSDLASVAQYLYSNTVSPDQFVQAGGNIVGFLETSGVVISAATFQATGTLLYDTSDPASDFTETIAMLSGSNGIYRHVKRAATTTTETQMLYHSADLSQVFSVTLTSLSGYQTAEQVSSPYVSIDETKGYFVMAKSDPSPARDDEANCLLAFKGPAPGGPPTTLSLNPDSSLTVEVEELPGFAILGNGAPPSRTSLAWAVNDITVTTNPAAWVTKDVTGTFAVYINAVLPS